MKPNLKLHQSQQMSLSPQLVQSIRLLQLSSVELEAEIAAVLESNPLLEAAPTVVADDKTNCASVVGDSVALAADAPQDMTEAKSVSSGDVDIDDSFAVADAWSASSGGDDEDEEGPIARAVAPTQGLRADIEAQLTMMIDDEDTAKAVVAIMENLDDSGYLSVPLASLATSTELSIGQMRLALKLIRSVAPTGFAARNLRECLMLQLDEVKAGTPGKNLAETIVMDHLPALGKRDTEPLRTLLGVIPERFQAAVALIRTLDPKPGLEPQDDVTRYVSPDVLVTGSAGAWKVELNPANLPRIRLNGLYEQVLTANPQGRGLKDKLNEARWLVRGLEMRHDTLLRTARVIFERQNKFLSEGELAMRPLTLREVAQAIEMHESTVSRVTTNKFVATPWGVFELKHFFSVSLASSESEASGVAVRAMIRQLVDAENPAKPLCDGAISAILARKGVTIARRTVAKYREAMKIKSASDRKVVANATMVKNANNGRFPAMAVGF